MAHFFRNDLRNSKHGLLDRIHISGLFGARNVYVPLNDSHPTVLTGPNGSGKSTILSLVHAASQGDAFRLHSVDFDSLTLAFQDGTNFRALRSGQHLTLSWDGYETTSMIPQALVNPPELVHRILREEEYDWGRVAEKLSNLGPAPFSTFAEFRQVRRAIAALEETTFFQEHEWLSEFSKYFPVEYITVGRLNEFMVPKNSNIPIRSGRTSDSSDSIVEASKYIARYVRNAEAEYGRMSQQSDQQLPRLVVRAMKSKALVTYDEVASATNSIQNHTERLRTLGLLENTEDETSLILSDLTYDDSSDILNVVKEILKSSSSRLDSLQTQEIALNSLKTFLDNRLSGKRLKISASDGLIFETANDRWVTVSQLSSGEQHLVILAFDLIFAAKRGALVLIDEPEISLHVSWQDELLGDLIALGSNQGLSYLMASHAPSIIAPMPECEWSLF